MNNSDQSRHSGAQAARDLGTWDDLRLAFRLYRDPRVSSLLKWLIPIVAAIYVISPIDLIPDFLLGAGQIDDLGVLGIALFMALNLIRRLAPKTIVTEHLTEMGRNGVRSSEPTAAPQTGEVIETTFRVSDRPTDRTYQRTAEDGRRVA